MANLAAIAVGRARRPASTRTAPPSSAATSPSTRRRRSRSSRTGQALARLDGAAGRPAGLQGDRRSWTGGHRAGRPRLGRLPRPRRAPAHDAEVERRTRRREPADDVGDAHLHLGHHRHAEGRDAHPRQPRLHRREGAGDPAGRGRATGSSATCRSRTSPSRSSRTMLSLATGACVHFAESLEKLPENLREVRPHFFLGVPRVWEKIQAGMQAAGAAGEPAAPADRGLGAAAWASPAATPTRRAGRGPGATRLAERLVFSKVRERLGFDETRMLVVSAAPIAKETLDFFQSLGLPIMEVYGMSECTGPTTMSLPARYRLGRAGLRAPRHRAADRRGRRDPDARPARLPRLLQERGGDARDARRRGLAALRRRRARSTPTASCGSPTARRS